MRRIRESFEGIKAQVMRQTGPNSCSEKLIRKCVPCGVMSGPEENTRKAGDSYSRHIDFINMFFVPKQK
jgi:hypothetical protein